MLVAKLIEVEIWFDADEVLAVAKDLDIEEPSVEDMVGWTIDLINEKLEKLKVEKSHE